MKSLTRSSLILFIALTANSEFAYGAGPPNVVESDDNRNTAMGYRALWITAGNNSTAAGHSALSGNTTGSGNTAFGTTALAMNKTGEANTAIGSSALQYNTTGQFNTASGYDALFYNTQGVSNTASGIRALFNNKTGNQNTATGSQALLNNTTGTNNTATGTDSLGLNTTGNYNTSAGVASMYFNTTGAENAATGYAALYRNTTGNNNTADGVNALYNNTTGINNTAMGHQAMFNNGSGYRNVAVGYQAGFAVTGSDNITIGAQNQGKAAENGVTRIGNKSYQAKIFIAGISGVKTGLAAAKTVFIDANGQLGTIKSSRVYKEDIHPMGSVSERLLALQPVTFRYKEAYDDGSTPVEFGLIAEDVAQVFPELVVNDADGKPETVRYDLVATLLLNEFQREHAIVEAQGREFARLKRELAQLQAIVARLDHVTITVASQ